MDPTHQKSKNIDQTRQPNLWVNPTHGQLCLQGHSKTPQVYKFSLVIPSLVTNFSILHCFRDTVEDVVVRRRGNSAGPVSCPAGILSSLQRQQTDHASNHVAMTTST